jgi:RimJ/RimL family protein N-acetyltransferase
MKSAPPVIQLVKWGAEDWDLLVQLNSPEMTEYLGGPESAEKLEDRQKRYVAAANSDTVYAWKVILQSEGVAVGSVNFWDREWKGEAVYEMGWGIVPEYQGRGIASAAVAQAIDLARATKRKPAVHAFPSIHNSASNGICRKVGFELLGKVQFEYPRGHWATSNDWRLAL